jgi:hypothetical protein
LKKFGIMVIAMAMLLTGIAIADPGNIEATNQISFIGENGAEITSMGNLFTCETTPAFCNTIEAGSSFTMEVVNSRTETNSRFVTESINNPLTLNHNIRIDKLTDTPSSGKVTAFMNGIIQEGTGTATDSFKSVEFKERTSISGRISLFDKVMGWESGINRV